MVKIIMKIVYLREGRDSILETVAEIVSEVFARRLLSLGFAYFFSATVKGSADQHAWRSLLQSFWTVEWAVGFSNCIFGSRELRKAFVLPTSLTPQFDFVKFLVWGWMPEENGDFCRQEAVFRLDMMKLQDKDNDLVCICFPDHCDHKYAMEFACWSWFSLLFFLFRQGECSWSEILTAIEGKKMSFLEAKPLEENLAREIENLIL